MDHLEKEIYEVDLELQSVENELNKIRSISKSLKEKRHQLVLQQRQFIKTGFHSIEEKLKFEEHRLEKILNHNEKKSTYNRLSSEITIPSKINNETSMQLKIVPLSHWEKTFGFPKVGTLKYLCLKRKENGFDCCVRMINKRIYLIVDKAFNYFENYKSDC